MIVLQHTRNLLTLLALTIPVTTYAGGLYVLEFGTPSMATASAGANALANDASTAFHNPAGMPRLTDSEFMLAGGALYTSIKFDPDPTTPVPGNDGGNAGGFAPLMSLYYAHKLNEKFSVGLSNYTLSAALMDYDDRWTGRYQATEVEVFTTNFLLSAGYQLSPDFAVGGGIAYMYASIDQSIALPTPSPTDGLLNLDVDGGDVGGVLSFLWQVNDATRLGAAYATKLEPDFSGDISINPIGLSPSASVDMIFPETIRLSAVNELDTRWSIMGSLNWERWSDFSSLDLRTGGLVASIPRNWEDVFSVAVGAHYKHSSKLTLKAGVSYTESPVGSSDRTADMPIDRQIRIAFGFERELDPKRTFGFAIEFVDLGDARINSPTLVGDYKENYMIAVAANMNWR
jgi:long-chain fatty acid transport protein